MRMRLREYGTRILVRIIAIVAGFVAGLAWVACAVEIDAICQPLVRAFSVYGYVLIGVIAVVIGRLVRKVLGHYLPRHTYSGRGRWREQWQSARRTRKADSSASGWYDS